MTLPLGPRAPSCRQGHHRPIRLGTWGTIMSSGAPPACQGHHSVYLDSTGISRILPSYQGYHRRIRDTTDLSGTPPIYQGNHPSIRGTIDRIYLEMVHTMIKHTRWLFTIPRICQGHHRPVRDTIYLSGTPPTNQRRHHRLIRGTVDLSRGGELGVLGVRQHPLSMKCTLSLPKAPSQNERKT